MSKKSSEKSFGLLFGFVFLLISIWPIFSAGKIRVWALILSLIFFFNFFNKTEFIKGIK